MVQTYNKLSKFSPDGGDELTVESFIRITTQEFTNLNTARIEKTIIDFDEDEDGIIQLDEFENLLVCLTNEQDSVRSECMIELENLLKH